MDSFDATTWQAIGVTLSVVFLVLSVLVWRYRGARSGLRGVAWSLLPAAAGLTGTLRLLWQIGDSIVDWATRLVFSPVVWVGIAMAGVSLMLFAITAAMRARGVGGRPSPSGERPAERESLPGRRSSTPATPASSQPTSAAGRRGQAKGSGGSGTGDEDMADIEAILRKHGIS